MKVRKILVLNGPNLDMLGSREPEIYGNDTLESLETEVRRYGEQRGVEVSCYQSNSEGKLVDAIHVAPGKHDAIVYNPGAHTHYSYALRDAVAAIDLPVVEVHLSDISDREPFRNVSVIAPTCIAQVKGMGVKGYLRAIDLLCGNVDYERLGEGHEGFAPGENIVTGRAIEPAPVQESELADASPGADDLGSLQLFGISDETAAPASAVPAAPDGAGADDITAAFAPAASAGDAGMLSFERQAAVRKACERLGVAALLVRDTSNVQWVTAFDGVFDEERAHGLLLAQGRAYLHTDSRYAHALRAVASEIGSDIVVNDERVSHVQFAYDALTKGGQAAQVGKLGIEDTITYAEFVRMVERFKTAGLASTTDVVLGLRAVKDDREIARMKAAQAVTDAAFAHIVAFMRPGMTERDVQLELEDFMVRHGAEALAFRSIVATGANGADPHAVPGNTRLESGQCVVLDFGAKAFGYCSDMTRTVFLGAPEGDMARAWETLRRANESVESMLRPGVTGSAAHQMAEMILEEGGFGGAMGHGLGHGVGIDVHELPMLNPRNDAPLVEGNVVTVEPGIYLPGRFGMRLEDFGVITATGFEVFTQSSHDMVVI